MKVSDLIKVLKKFPKDAQVVYACHSEHCLLDALDLKLETLSYPRTDGWVHDKRADKPEQVYLTFP